MHGRMTAVKCGVLVLAVALSVTVAQASSLADHTTSLMNPWDSATIAVSKAVDRTLTHSVQMPHAGFDNFSSWSLFTDYDFGKNKDKRQGGFDNYFNSYTVGADALYGNTLWGFMGNYNDAQGRSGAARNSIDSWTYSLYMSRAINDWMFWGTSFTYGTSESKIRGTAGTTDSDSYVIAPYLTMVARMDRLTLSMSPSYVLGYQKVDYPAGGGKDTALMGKLVLMGRASYALDQQWSIAGNLNYNQVVHNHGLDTEFDNDHQWFTTGIKLNCKVTENLSGSLGYSTDFDSSFDSKIWNIGLVYAF